MAWRSGAELIKSLMREWMSKAFKMSMWTFMRDKCVSLFCVMVDRNHVFNRRKLENDRSDEATDIGKHRHNCMSFSASVNRALV